MPAEHRVPRLVTASADEAQDFLEHTIGSGHEGVVVKNLHAPYDAAGAAPRGSRSPVPPSTWSCLRSSGARAGARAGCRTSTSARARPRRRVRDARQDLQGMTDEMLAWQTERFLGWRRPGPPMSSHVRPEQVVEIAFDGVQRSSRYPGGVALRFARGGAYRDDKPVAEIDTIDTVRGFLPAEPAPTARGDTVTPVQLRSCTPYDVAVSTFETDGRRTASCRPAAGPKQIIDATARALRRAGVRDAQIEDIAKAVGINRAIVYRHFTGKEEVFALTLVGYLDELRPSSPTPPRRRPTPRTGWPRWSAPSWSTAWRTRRSSTAPRP